MGNEVMNVGTLLQYARDFRGERRAGETTRALLAWLEANHLDPASGLWGELEPRMPLNLSNLGMAAYYLWPLFLYDHRQPPFPAPAIDSILCIRIPGADSAEACAIARTPGTRARASTSTPSTRWPGSLSAPAIAEWMCSPHWAALRPGCSPTRTPTAAPSSWAAPPSPTAIPCWSREWIPPRCSLPRSERSLSPSWAAALRFRGRRYRLALLRVSGNAVLERALQHLPDSHCRLIRGYGLYSSRALGTPGHRGRSGALDCAAPPSEPDKRISRIRLSSQRFTAERTDRAPHGLRSWRKAHGRQRMHLASASGRRAVPPGACRFVCAESCVASCVSTRPRIGRCRGSCA